MIAVLLDLPASIDTTESNPLTFVNKFDLVVSLLTPSSPYKFEPVAYTSPVLFNIIVWFLPALISIASCTYFAFVTGILSGYSNPQKCN